MISPSLRAAAVVVCAKSPATSMSISERQSSTASAKRGSSARQRWTVRVVTLATLAASAFEPPDARVSAALGHESFNFYDVRRREATSLAAVVWFKAITA